jgi:hypothetical protein
MGSHVGVNKGPLLLGLFRAPAKSGMQQNSCPEEREL